jgi:hypothetical protein
MGKCRVCVFVYLFNKEIEQMTHPLSNHYPYIADNVWKKSSLLRYQIDIKLLSISLSICYR